MEDAAFGESFSWLTCFSMSAIVLLFDASDGRNVSRKAERQVQTKRDAKKREGMRRWGSDMYAAALPPT